jgi:hypothetical protein
VGAERLFLAPNMAALYCALGRRSPSWWLYFYFPMSDPEQDELVRSLDRDADWALLADPPPAPGREKSFRKTHPLVWAHFERVWQRVQAPGLPADLALFRRAP